MQTDGGREVPQSTRGSGGLKQAAVASLVCITFVVLALGSAAAVRWVTAAARHGTAPNATAAYFSRPLVVDSAVAVGHPLAVVVVPGSGEPIRWSAQCDGRRIGSGGFAHPRPGRHVTFAVPTDQCRRLSRVSVVVSGIRTPLQAWLK